MKVVVTGGAGFIGSHLARSLCDQGHHVSVLDNLSTGKMANLDWSSSQHRFEFVRGDISSLGLLQPLIASADWVFHLAAEASVPYSVTHPLEAHLVNLDATFRLLLLAKEAKVKRLVFASSSAVYGDAGSDAATERAVISPLSPYGLQKYASETYARLFHELYALPSVSLRFFNVYGPRQAASSPYSGVIAKFCTSLLSSEAPKIYGDGLQCRDFVFVSDVVQALTSAAELPVERVAGRSFNIGTGRSATLLDLVEILNQLIGSRISPEMLPPRVGDIKISKADISQAVKELNFRPRFSLKDGLQQTLEFYRKDR